MSAIQCVSCGMFCGEKDFALGHCSYTPESEFTHERIEWTCRRCAPSQRDRREAAPTPMTQCQLALVPVREWRCVNCKHILFSRQEPQECNQCWCRDLALIDAAPPSVTDPATKSK